MSQPALPPRRASRWPAAALRGLLRLLVALAVLFAVVTLACVGYNAATRPAATLAAPDGEDLTVDGVRVHYRHWPGRGPVVVLVHGFAESTVSWQPVAELLARDHDVYALDLPGYGYTEYSGRYRLDDGVAALDGLTTGLRLHRPLLVGHSAGAAVVGAQALRHPGHVGGVVFADGDALPFPGDQHGGRPDWILRTPWFTTGYRLVTRTGWLYRPLVRRVCGSQCHGFTPELADAWLRPMRQGDAEGSLPAMAAQGVLHLDAAEIRAITVPRGIIWGAEDATGGGSLAATRVNLQHPDERIIPNAGHLSMLAAPDLFANALRALERGMGLGR